MSSMGWHGYAVFNLNEMAPFALKNAKHWNCLSASVSICVYNENESFCFQCIYPLIDTDRWMDGWILFYHCYLWDIREAHA